MLVVSFPIQRYTTFSNLQNI